MRSLTHLKLVQGKATASAKLGIVTNSWCADSRAKQTINRTRSNCSRLLNTVIPPSLLRAGLVEPGLYAQLPLLAEVLVGQNIVVSHDLEHGKKRLTRQATKYTQLKVPYHGPYGSDFAIGSTVVRIQ